MVDHELYIFQLYTDENRLVFRLDFKSVYLLNNFDLKEFGLEKLPQGFNRFLLIGLDIIVL